MTENDLEYRRFRVAKGLAKEKICQQKVYWNSADLFSRINKTGLEDAQAILRVFEREIKDHNSKMSAAETRLDNLNYKSSNVYNSKAFKGLNINLKKIDKAILANPDLDDWKIVEQFL